MSQICRVDALRTLGFGSINNVTYTELGGEFEHPMRLLKIVNNTNGDMLISFDGTTDNDFIPAGGFSLYDIMTNKENAVPYFVFANGTQMFVKYSTAPTSGAVYVVCVYGQGE